MDNSTIFHAEDIVDSIFLIETCATQMLYSGGAEAVFNLLASLMGMSGDWQCHLWQYYFLSFYRYENKTVPGSNRLGADQAYDVTVAGL